MDILISFNNTFKTPGYPCLGLLDADTMKFRFVELPPEVPQTGMLGLTVSSNYIFIGLQHSSAGPLAYLSPPALLIFDRNNFKLLQIYIFQVVKDVHSFLLTPDESALFVVSSGTDELIKLILDGVNVVSEKVFWCPDPEGERSDNYHLNSIYGYQGDIYVSGFGKKTESEDWNSARNGFIYNISKGEQIVSGLEHPHSILVVDGLLTICESRKRKLRFIGNEKTIELPGYVRGLCTAADKIFVGTSARRNKSKSTGKIVKQAGLELAECTISRISGKSLQVEERLDLKDYANEIYELLPVEGTSSWPVSVPRNYHLEFEQSWLNQENLAMEEIQEAVSTEEPFILVDENTWNIDNAVLPNRKRLHFLERDGIYWGPPENDEIAISELKRMQQEQKVRFIAFGWPSFWWFDYYKKFMSYLRHNFSCIVNNDRVVIFDLHEH